MLPAAGRKRPAINRRNEVLPAPFGPVTSSSLPGPDRETDSPETRAGRRGRTPDPPRSAASKRRPAITHLMLRIHRRDRGFDSLYKARISRPVTGLHVGPPTRPKSFNSFGNTTVTALDSFKCRRPSKSGPRPTLLQSQGRREERGSRDLEASLLAQGAAGEPAPPRGRPHRHERGHPGGRRLAEQAQRANARSPSARRAC